MNLEKKTGIGISITSGMLLTILVAYTHCGKNASIHMIPQTEQASLESSEGSSAVFSGPVVTLTEEQEQFVAEHGMTGVLNDGDSYIPVDPYAENIEDLEFIKRCCSSGSCREDYEKERQEVIELAENDPDHLTIPVRYSISTGTKSDIIAQRAYYRTVLRSDDPGTQDIYIGAINDANYAGKSYYTVDHSEAKSQYIKGQRCYFSTVKVLSKKAGLVPFPPTGKHDHQWSGIVYGAAYTNLEAAKLSPRLFKSIENQESPQIVPLYVADIREKFIDGNIGDNTYLNSAFSSGAVRRQEYEKSFKDIFNLDVIFKDREYLTQKLCQDRSIAGFNLSSYEGCPQLIQNLSCASQATITAVRYTPLVLDLGRPHIRTSSDTWGTYFNIANAVTNEGAKDISIRTAWLGGHLEKIQDPSGKDFWTRRADDAFLAIPDADGKIQTSAQLIGSQTEVDGVKYENGFEALRAIAGKDCSSEDIKNRYLGPWDEAYQNILKVWTDANRNGVNEEGELSTLQESHVAAINTCYIKHREELDLYGNETKLRAAMLYVEEGFDFTDTDEIVARLESGKKADGSDAEYRVIIDVLFKAHPYEYLERHDIQDIIFPESIPKDDDGEIIPLPFVIDA